VSQPRDDRQDNLFRPALEQISRSSTYRHPLLRLAAEINWGFSSGTVRFGLSRRARAAAVVKHRRDDAQIVKKGSKDRTRVFRRRNGLSERKILDPVDRAEGRGLALATIGARLFHRQKS
jgi:hypothetical protein